MALQQRLVQKQIQNLAMTKQLRQAIELLELSTIDLYQTVADLTQENPLLSLEETSPESPSTDGGDQPSDDVAFDNQYHDSGRTPPSTRNSSFNEFGMENISGPTETLYEHMAIQIRTQLADPRDQFLAFAFLNDLCPSGYLEHDEKVFCQRLTCSRENYNKMLDFLQHLDPPGAFARNLKECLSLQLETLGDLTPRFQILLDNLDLLARGDLGNLCKRMGCPVDELKEMIQDLKDLNPKPGLVFEQEGIPARQPDAFIWIDPETQEIRLRIDDRFSPQVRLDESYTSQFTHQDKSFKTFVSERLTQGNWLLRALEQRQENFKKTLQALADYQYNFFAKGVEGLKPMTLKQIADTIGVHESTISRISQKKYIQCPQGVFELKYFFSASISNAWTGEDQSATAIQHAIQKLVDGESPTKPLSDDQLVKHLCEIDISVARRTVTKYRELLNIPSSYDRARRYRLTG